jgi:hypothetical protein
MPRAENISFFSVPINPEKFTWPRGEISPKNFKLIFGRVISKMEKPVTIDLKSARRFWRRVHASTKGVRSRLGAVIAGGSDGGEVG